MSVPAYSYMITNRKDPTAILELQAPLPGSGLWWYLSTTGPNDQQYGDYSSFSGVPETTAPASWISPLVAELRAQAQPSLTVFIHGLDADWSNAVEFTGLLGQNLAGQGYRGLVVGFSWPSMGETDGVLYSNGYPPAATPGTVRGNICASVESFGSFIAWTRSLAGQVPGLQVNLVCHSEGNFMLMTGMSGIATAALNQVVMLAADVNDGAFQVPPPPPTLVGQAARIAALSNFVTVYYSSNDYTLALCQGVFSCQHNPGFGGRLGLSGPNYDAGPQEPNVIGLDCSAVVNTAYVSRLPAGVVPAGAELHISYFYIPQVLADMAQTLGNTPAGSVANRGKTATANAYVMQAVTSAS